MSPAFPVQVPLDYGTAAYLDHEAEAMTLRVIAASVPGTSPFKTERFAALSMARHQRETFAALLFSRHPR